LTPSNIFVKFEAMCQNLLKVNAKIADKIMMMLNNSHILILACSRDFSGSESITRFRIYLSSVPY